MKNARMAAGLFLAFLTVSGPAAAIELSNEECGITVTLDGCNELDDGTLQGAQAWMDCVNDLAQQVQNAVDACHAQ